LLRLHQLFFTNFITITILALFVSGVTSYYTLKNIKISQWEDELKKSIEIFEIAFEKNSFENIDETVKKIKDKSGFRVTIIDTGGEVLAESHKNIIEMENHANRPEILESKYQTYGSSLRFSAFSINSLTFGLS